MDPTGSQPEASFIYVVGRVNQGIRGKMRVCLAHWGLSVQEFTTLSVLSSRPGLSNAQLARRALVTPQAMIEILAKLEDRRLVHREVDPLHGRILRAQATATAHTLLATVEPHIRAIQDDMLSSVSLTDREATMETMRTAMTNLSGGHNAGLQAPERRA